ncbi:hypothetical protein KIPB_016070, partial [Kipferlia bialata]|eukprot:g16070.t1
MGFYGELKAKEARLTAILDHLKCLSGLMTSGTPAETMLYRLEMSSTLLGTYTAEVEAQEVVSTDGMGRDHTKSGQFCSPQ